MKTISTSNLIKKYTEKPIMEISDNENISSHKIILVSIDYKLNNKYLNSLYFEKNKELFNQFAHEQWNGIKVYTGQYLVLFDSVHGCSIYNVIFVDFEGITITNMTSFQLSNKENITSIDFDLMNYIAHSIDVDRKKLIQSKKITLKIIGYVNSSNYIDEEESNITDLMLFKEYIREQYKESELKKNQYIFDHNLFRGLACKITCIEP